MIAITFIEQPYFILKLEGDTMKTSGTVSSMVVEVRTVHMSDPSERYKCLRYG